MTKRYKYKADLYLNPTSEFPTYIGTVRAKTKALLRRQAKIKAVQEGALREKVLLEDQYSTLTYTFFPVHDNDGNQKKKRRKR